MWAESADGLLGNALLDWMTGGGAMKLLETSVSQTRFRMTPEGPLELVDVTTDKCSEIHCDGDC